MKLRFSKHDFVVHSILAQPLYIAIRLFTLLFSSVMWSQLFSVFGTILFGGLLLEIIQQRSHTGKAQTTDYLAVYTSTIMTGLIDMAIWQPEGYTIKGAVFPFIIMLLIWFYNYNKTKPVKYDGSKKI